jgi:hypothetical protein
MISSRVLRKWSLMVRTLLFLKRFVKGRAKDLKDAEYMLMVTIAPTVAYHIPGTV